MFSKTVVLLFVLTNVLYANCRPQAELVLVDDENVPQLSGEQMNTIFRNPTFINYLQQLLAYFSTLLAQQQGGGTSQVLQSQQSSSQSNSQQASAAAQRQEEIISKRAALLAPFDLSAGIQTSSSAQSQSSQSSENKVSNEIANLLYNLQGSQTLQSNVQNTQQSQELQNTLQHNFSQNIHKSTNEYGDRLGANNAQNTIHHQGKPVTQGVYDPVLEKTQSQNANYKYATLMDDNIEGNFQQKEEKRQDGKVTGSYAYDDGYVMRKVVYEADDKGYRILKDEILPSAKQEASLDGKATIKTNINGADLGYVITTADFQKHKL